MRCVIVYKAGLQTLVSKSLIAMTIARQLGQRGGNCFRYGVSFTRFAYELPRLKRRRQTLGRNFTLVRRYFMGRRCRRGAGRRFRSVIDVAFHVSSVVVSPENNCQCPKRKSNNSYHQKFILHKFPFNPTLTFARFRTDAQVARSNHLPHTWLT